MHQLGQPLEPPAPLDEGSVGAHGRLTPRPVGGSRTPLPSSPGPCSTPRPKPRESGRRSVHCGRGPPLAPGLSGTGEARTSCLWHKKCLRGVILPPSSDSSRKGSCLAFNRAHCPQRTLCNDFVSQLPSQPQHRPHTEVGHMNLLYFLSPLQYLIFFLLL